MASTVDRFGRKPYEFGSAVVSATGINAMSQSACMARSAIVGIPKGRVLPLALGMLIRLNGSGRYPRCRICPTAVILDFGVDHSLPSTPAVRLPRFEVTRLTANTLA